MDRLLFGISGLPLGDSKTKYNYVKGIEYLHSIGLSAMELPFVRSVNVTPKNAPLINEIKDKYNFYLSAHGSYYINLNADESEKVESSLERIVKGGTALKSVGGRSLIFHAGYYLKSTKEDTLKNIKNNLRRLPTDLVDYRLETTGKSSQFGDIDELIEISKEIPSCKICIDYSHIHARGNGCLKTYDDFAQILQKIVVGLGQEALEDLHFHISGIKYTSKGEYCHLPLMESDFKFDICMSVIKDFGVKGCIICESPILERDALLLKETYEKI